MGNTNLTTGRNEVYVVSYDICNDRLRNKVAKALLNYGKRVQYSVFECRISQKQYDEMYKKLAMLIADSDSGEDSIRIYHLCGKCDAEVRELGMAKDEAYATDDPIIV